MLIVSDSNLTPKLLKIKSSVEYGADKESLGMQAVRAAASSSGGCTANLGHPGR